MRRTTAQRLLMVSGVLALLGGGTCYFSINPPHIGDALGWGILGGLAGIGLLLIAVILGIVGLVGWYGSRD